MNLGTILLIILTLPLISGLPTFPHSRNQGYGPSGIIGTLLVTLLVLLLLDTIQDPIGNTVVVVRHHDGYRRITPPTLFTIHRGFLTFAPPL